jgi:hypothetical protein
MSKGRRLRDGARRERGEGMAELREVLTGFGFGGCSEVVSSLVALPPRPMQDRPEGASVTTAERRRWEALQADRHALDVAAAWLRYRAWEQSYAGFKDKDRCFALASLLESLSVQLDRVPEGLRIEAVRTAQWLVGGSSAVRF